jgi:hypothetical protein
VIGEASGHRGRDACCLVNPTVVVVHEVQRDVVGAILDFLAGLTKGGANVPSYL